MPWNDERWRDWGKRFRVLVKENGETLASVAEALGRSEPALRSWTNGNRQINLSEFFALCAAAKVDPAHVLFGRIGLSTEQKARLGELVVSVLESDTATHQDYPKLVRGLQRDLKRKTKKS